MMELPLSQLRKLTPPSHYFRVSNWRRRRRRRRPTHSLSPDLFCRERNWGPARRVFLQAEVGLKEPIGLYIKTNCKLPSQECSLEISNCTLRFSISGRHTTECNHVQRGEVKGKLGSTAHSSPSIFRASIVGNDWPHSDFLKATGSVVA